MFPFSAQNNALSLFPGLSIPQSSWKFPGDVDVVQPFLGPFLSNAK